MHNSIDALRIPHKIRSEALNYINYPIYTASIGGSWFLFRTLTYKEFKQYQRALEFMTQWDCYLFLSDKCLLYPESTNKIPAFHIPKLSSAIYDVSGFGNPKAFEDALRFCRSEMDGLETGTDIFLKTFIPNVTDDSLNEMDFMSRMRLVALAEKVSQEEIPLEGDKKRKGALQGNIPIDPAGLENAISMSRQETPINDKISREVESYSITNTRIGKK